jgi:hypothetical protein
MLLFNKNVINIINTIQKIYKKQLCRAELGILIRQSVDFNEVDSTGHFFYFLIKIRYKYDRKTTIY